MRSRLSLISLNDDVLVSILSYMSIPDVMSTRKTCGRLALIARYPALWKALCDKEIRGRDIPFPEFIEDSLDLEARVLRAWHLHQRWLAFSSRGGKLACNVVASRAVSVSTVDGVQFVPGYDANWVLLVCKGIWSVLILWDVRTMTKLAEWKPRGVIIDGFTVSSDSDGQKNPTVAVSAVQDDTHTIVVLELRKQQHKQGLYEFVELTSIETSDRPLILTNSLLVHADDFTKASVYDLNLGKCIAELNHNTHNDDLYDYDKAMQAVFVNGGILIVRARSLCLFPLCADNKLDTDEAISPTRSIASCSFGWVDGVSVCKDSDKGRKTTGLNILVRAESDDPWTAHEQHALDLYALDPNLSHTRNPKAPAFHFPPRLAARVLTVKGSLRCPIIRLKESRTAVWLCPRDRSRAGLVVQSELLDTSNSSRVIYELPGPQRQWTGSKWGLTMVPDHPAFGEDEDIEASVAPSNDGASPEMAGETLVAAIFPSTHMRIANGNAVQPRLAVAEGKKQVIWFSPDPSESVTALDYDEVAGRIVLGSSNGRLTILDL